MTIAIKVFFTCVAVFLVMVATANVYDNPPKWVKFYGGLLVIISVIVGFISVLFHIWML